MPLAKRLPIITDITQITKNRTKSFDSFLIFISIKKI
jgi:hypothetical protein